MSYPHIEDIIIEFEGDKYSKYGLFPLVAWYLLDILMLPEYFTGVSVKRKRNRAKPIKRRKPKYDTNQMCIGIIAIILLGVVKFRKINDVLSTEEKIAQLVGLPKFFDQSTVHLFLNEFQKWHVTQLDKVNHRLILNYGESARQDILVLDIDSTTHSLESRKREKAVTGFNKKNRGKPCYQWTVAFVRGEAISQKLNAGNTHCKVSFKEMVLSAKAKLSREISIIRVDGGYLSGKNLEFVVTENLQIVTTAPYKWILSQGVKLDPDKWEPYNEDTKLYDLGLAKVISTTDNKFRVVLVVTKQDPFSKKMKNKKKIHRYAIIENLAIRLEANALYEFYHERQTIENFFKESKEGFGSGKMPSQSFRANEAYLQFVAIACNCFHWFKKNFFHQSGRVTLWQPLGQR